MAGSLVAQMVKTLPAVQKTPVRSLGREDRLESPMDRGGWRAIVHRVAKSQTQLSDFHHHTEMEDGTSGLLRGS